MDVFKQNAKNKNTKKATSNEILTVPKYQTSKGNVVIGRKFSRIIIVKTIWTRSCYCLVVLCFKRFIVVEFMSRFIPSTMRACVFVCLFNMSSSCDNSVNACHSCNIIFIFLVIFFSIIFPRASARANNDEKKK